MLLLVVLRELRMTEGGESHRDSADVVKETRGTTGGSEVAHALGEQMADFGNSPLLVVGQAQLPGPNPSYVADCSWFAPTLHPSPSPTQILSIHRTLYVVLGHTGGTRSRERRLQLDVGF